MHQLSQEPSVTTTDNMLPEQCFDLAMEAIGKENWQEAVALLCKTITLDPACAEAYNNLGSIFKDNGQLDQAEACLRKAIEIDPYCINAFYNLAFVYQEGDYITDAEICFRHVLTLDPYNADAHHNLGVLLERLYHSPEAEDCYRQTIALDPDYGPAYYNLGKILQRKDQLAKAKEYLLRAGELAPLIEHIQMGIACFHLSLGQYEEGWAKYNKILHRKHPSGCISNIPIWRGEDLTGCKILLYCEQGLGDTIQFIRYATLVSALADETVLFVQQSLQRLLAATYSPLAVYSVGEDLPGTYDFVCSVHLLPIVFKSTDETIPRFPSYIQALPAEANFWREQLATTIDGGNSYRVGVVWAGNPKNAMDRYRSIPFAIFSKLFTNTDVRWISLQVGKRAEDCNSTPEEILLDVSSSLVDFCETAGVIANLDLIITMDTSIAHFAAAMGKKTWILLDGYCDWRWQLKREDSPWYPSVRLFRQQTLGDWPEVIERILVALRQEYANHFLVYLTSPST